MESRGRLPELVLEVVAGMLELPAQVDSLTAFAGCQPVEKGPDQTGVQEELTRDRRGKHKPGLPQGGRTEQQHSNRRPSPDQQKSAESTLGKRSFWRCRKKASNR